MCLSYPFNEINLLRVPCLGLVLVFVGVLTSWRGTCSFFTFWAFWHLIYLNFFLYVIIPSMGFCSLVSRCVFVSSKIESFACFSRNHFVSHRLESAFFPGICLLSHFPCLFFYKLGMLLFSLGFLFPWSLTPLGRLWCFTYTILLAHFPCLFFYNFGMILFNLGFLFLWSFKSSRVPLMLHLRLHAIFLWKVSSTHLFPPLFG
jgi:hypothetical protein